ncbi:pectate lyase [Aureimonas phyllosphaerae]|uniref:Pectate lyase, PelA/Pel-15E family n=1 Tax=Aureimonas phyllosphaerae TaxID=1166078 RepID=A0A7W6FW62_9HYPH|nr:pectate lyase [Aureimonas phyllosphaerae]MBB3937545.1 hypothetical protein [Aureimonas phyllosphaerae]MBB3961655.1 hypothetical protein [Aureimonas phyllosphaerae]SFF46323.1 pectate lyase, PelA/Pel-15E family [Aureimonas phyllosphaerae]
MIRLGAVALLVFLVHPLGGRAQDTGETAPGATARQAMEKAGAFFRDRLGVHGTYVWRYSLDGRRREVEGGSAAPSVGWVQPPGTPAVGAAFLRIYEATGDAQWLDAAHTVAAALVDGQLMSGGWHFSIETDPDERENWCYRSRDIEAKACQRIKDNRSANRTVLDDNTSQSVFNFLIWFDEANDGKDRSVREAIDYGLGQLMRVQYRNGAFPNFFSTGAPGADVETASHASMPASWSPDWQKPETPPYFIVNDNVPRDTGRLFLSAYKTYRNPDYLKAAMRLGDFLVAAQLPHPQEGWAQQYDRTLQPVWGRKFEPPAVVSRETAGSIDFLLELYQASNKARYLEAARSAGDWLTGARLSDGTWARYYELNTNRPLYVDNDNRVTFEPVNLLTHYGMKGEFEIPLTLARLARVLRGERPTEPNLWVSPADDLGPDQLQKDAAVLMATQDPEGRWADGEWVDGKRFVDAVFVLARHAAIQDDAEQ